MQYFRPSIDAMSGYAPGEQPVDKRIVKLNTNENPYPPSPAVAEALRSFDADALRRYPDPLCEELRRIVADLHHLQPENVIVGNGSDDILTIATRAFAGEGEGDSVVVVDPTYSLYDVLAKIQGVSCRTIPLEDDWSLPIDVAARAGDAKLFFIPRPNAPTGNAFDLAAMETLCREFRGVVLIDEAYADFADDDCVGFVGRFPNVVVSRTLSKSYSLAGVRLGYALASKEIIEGMMKVKDSYNVNDVTQTLAAAALLDRKTFDDNASAVKASRKRLAEGLRSLGFDVAPSRANFVFAAPPDRNGQAFFDYLRSKNILVRYFSGERVGAYVRITVGRPDEIEALLEATKGYAGS